MNGNAQRQEYMGTSGKMMQDEAGGSDNRLSWSPGEFPETKEWSDGEQYTVTLVIRQTSPGEGQIISMKSAEPEEAKESPNDTEGETGETQGGGGAAEYENPAIAKLMAAKKS